jgi:hypothetical protein
MTQTERTGDRRVELHVRETLPEPAGERRAAVTDRLEALAADGVVDGYDVFTWDKRIRVDGTGDRGTRDLYLSFVGWADEEGVGLRPFFDTRECYSMATGEFGRWLVLPALCLAVYEDGDLAAVYPHADGREFRSVEDCLDSLADDGSDSRERDERAVTAAD